ncbi:hypothetical protein L195_g064313, partial [Trifolium pratense]
MIAGIIDAELR